MSTEAKQKKSFLDSLMGGIEKAVNKLPSPFTMFLCLFVITAVIALILQLTGATVVHPTSGEAVLSQNFFSEEGILWLLRTLVTNFTGYAPLGLVLTMTLGIGLCEQCGMVNALLRNAMQNIPPKLAPFVVAFIGIEGNLASDSSAYIIPPLAGLVFLGVGLHPVAGMLVGYTGTNAGFSANLMIAGTDSLLQGITNQVLTGFTPGYTIEVTANWYFMIASTFFLSIVIGLLDIFVIEPRLGKYEGKALEGAAEQTTVSPEEKKALRVCGIFSLLYIAVIAAGCFQGMLLNEGSIVGSPLLSGLVPILFGLFITAGLSYGITIGSIKTERDATKMLIKSIGTMTSYITTVFMTAQFIALFNWTNLGTILAVSGANFLNLIGLKGLPLLVSFILLTAIVNLLVGSGSAKWSILAPIFVPMLMLMGYDPGLIQLVYRIGDSSTNIMSPIAVALFMMLDIAQEKYDENIQLGHLYSILTVNAVVILITWIIFFTIYWLIGVPIGPGQPSLLPDGVLTLA